VPGDEGIVTSKLSATEPKMEDDGGCRWCFEVENEGEEERGRSGTRRR
jgi:hypothetical protein